MSTPDAIVPKSPEARPGKEVKPEHTGPHRPWGESYSWWESRPWLGTGAQRARLLLRNNHAAEVLCLFPKGQLLEKVTPQDLHHCYCFVAFRCIGQRC